MIWLFIILVNMGLVLGVTTVSKKVLLNSCRYLPSLIFKNLPNLFFLVYSPYNITPESHIKVTSIR